MEERDYTIADVLTVIKSQLMTIHVSGTDVTTLAAVYKNLDACLEVIKKEKDDGK